MHSRIFTILLSLFSFTLTSQNSFESVKAKIKYIDSFKTWRHFVDHFETREEIETYFAESAVSMSFSNGVPI